MAASTLIGLVLRGSGTWSLPGTDPATPAKARAYTRALLAHLDPGLVYDVVTVVSELVTNAIRYTPSGDAGGRLDLEVVVDHEAVCVSVADQGGQDMPVIGPEGRLEGGLGLLVCADLGRMSIDRTEAGHLVTVRIPLGVEPC